MILRSIGLKTFRQHADSQVVFRDGVTAFVGANGSGKSSILEAITWALYGADALRGKAGSIRWWRARPRQVAEVSLYFEVRDQGYIIHRTENDARLSPWPTGTPLAAGTSAVNKYIPTLLGMTLAEFRGSYLCEQKDLARLAAMLPAERKDFYRSVMGISRIDRALDRCRERARAIAQELAGLAAGLGPREPVADEVEQAAQAMVDAGAVHLVARLNHETARQAAADAAEDLTLADAVKREHEAAQAALREAEQVHGRATAELTRILQEIFAADAAAHRYAAASEQLAALPELRTRRDQLVGQRATATERELLFRGIGAADHDIAAYTESIGACERTVAAFDAVRLAAVATEYRAIEQEGEQTRRTRMDAYADAHAAMNAAKRRADELRAQLAIIRSRGQDGDCPTCLRALGEQLRTVLTTIQQSIESEDQRASLRSAEAVRYRDIPEVEHALTVQLQTLRTEGEQLRDRKNAAARAHEEIGRWERSLAMARESGAEKRRKLEALPVVDRPAEAELAALDAEIRTLAALEQSSATDRVIAGRLDQLRVQASDGRRQVDARRVDIDSARLRSDLIKYDYEAHQALTSRVAQLRNAREEAAAGESAAGATLTAARERARRSGTALQDYDARASRLEVLETGQRTHERAADALKRFSAAQLDRLRPELEALLSGFIGHLTDGRHEAATIDDSYGVLLSEGGVDAPVISGGTQDIAAIALRLAVSQMIAARAGHPLSLLILDEPFGELDEVRRANVLGLIRRLASAGELRQILLISHIEETRTAADVVYDVTFDEPSGSSQVLTADRIYEIVDDAQDGEAAA